MKEEKTLIFEGAGWDSAEHNGIGNCRIRTRIQNKEGRIIYFECGGHENTKFRGYVDHCFDVKDERTNHTKDLIHIERLHFRYNSINLIKFVNKHLDCDFTELKVLNEGLRVHDTKNPLCSCRV